MKIIIYDFEVFKKDCLLGAMIIDGPNKTIYQTWDPNEIKKFYYLYENDLWIGHNNWFYDDAILEGILKGKDPYQVNINIIKNNYRYRTEVPKYSYDLMNSNDGRVFQLKLTELLDGKNIHTTDVSFDLDRELNDEEKRLTEGYNKDDLLQTDHNLGILFNRLKLRLDMIKEFNLDLSSSLKLTGTQIASKVLDAHKNPALEHSRIAPKLYDNLILENEEVKRFYLAEEFAERKNTIVHIGNAELHIGAGGIHSAIAKYHSDKAMYFDVSGYYNLVMMNYDLLPRTMSEKGKELYTKMYHDQLAMKKSNPQKRKVYKTILLSVFGAMLNPYGDFYDPYKGNLVTITGQLFLCDLLEKLKDKALIIQSNTDGIMIEPFDWKDEEEITKIVEDWEKRTHFVCKKEYIYNLWQRDVNNYICLTESGDIDFKGEIVKNYDVSEKAYGNGDLYDCQQPPIVSKGIVDYLLFGITPEETVAKNKDDLRLFQYTCKKNTYHYLTEDVIFHFKSDKDKWVESLESSTKIKPLNRAFAKKKVVIDSSFYTTTITKHKEANGKHSQAKIANLPDDVFIFNEDIRSKEKVELINSKIDWDFYITRIYERIMEFIPQDN